VDEHAIIRRDTYMPGGAELTHAAESHLGLDADARLLSVACGSAEIELYLAARHGCSVVGLDLSEGMLAIARRKIRERGADDRVRLLRGDGHALPFRAASFDAIFCCGALCEFFDDGLVEFGRVLPPGGRAAVIDVVWRHEDVPRDVQLCWTGDSARVLTREGNRRAFEAAGFRVLHDEERAEPDWWEAYYTDRGDGEHWRRERENYRAHREHLGLGLFVLVRS